MARQFRPVRRAHGAPGRTRTCDPRLRRPVLYPAELRALEFDTLHHDKYEMVGAAGFEPATLCSQSRCATRLRHAPPESYLPKACEERPRTGRGILRIALQRVKPYLQPKSIYLSK